MRRHFDTGDRAGANRARRHAVRLLRSRQLLASMSARRAMPKFANVRYPSTMDQPTFEDLVSEVRKSAVSDVEFAQRVALVCCTLVATKKDPVAAIS